MLNTKPTQIHVLHNSWTHELGVKNCVGFLRERTTPQSLCGMAHTRWHCYAAGELHLTRFPVLCSGHWGTLGEWMSWWMVGLTLRVQKNHVTPKTSVRCQIMTPRRGSSWVIRSKEEGRPCVTKRRTWIWNHRSCVGPLCVLVKPNPVWSQQFTQNDNTAGILYTCKASS